MRTLGLRLTGTLALCVLAASLTGCESKNRGTIIGHWKIVTSSKTVPEFEELTQAGVAIDINFKSDGSFWLNYLADNDTEEARLTARRCNESLRGKDWGGRYKREGGDRVTLTGATDVIGKAGYAVITVNGDTMTIVAADVTLTLQRIK